jgi:hypothetical protein
LNGLINSNQGGLVLPVGCGFPQVLSRFLKLENCAAGFAFLPFGFGVN